MSEKPSLAMFPDACMFACDGTPDHWGYTLLAVSKGKKVRAHRVSYRLFVGKIPPQMVLMHSCDNPACINPRHLVLGSHQDNHRDMMEKGRNKRGDQTGQAKITEADARAILVSSDSYTALATRYGLTKSGIAAIKKRRTWKHLSEGGAK